jgi:hypothetical protein
MGGSASLFSKKGGGENEKIIDSNVAIGWFFMPGASNAD